MSCSSIMRLSKCEKNVMAIGDLHEPFAHPDAPDFLDWIRKKFKPDTFVCLGDEIDGHAMSNYESDPDGFSPGMELDAAIQKLRTYYQMFPRMHVCTSNHTARPFRKAFSSGIPARVLKGYREILDAPAGWEWRDQWRIDGVAYEHGEGQIGQNAAMRAADGNMCPTVIGHIHSFAGIQYNANAETLYWGFNVGCLINRDAYSFRYGKHFKRKPIIGCGLVERGVPRFVPMLLDRKGRWIKRT
jgi:hypothetical protein